MPEPRLLPRPAGSAIALCLLLVGLVALGFLPTLGNGFVNFDDTVYVYENAHVQGGVTLAGIRWAFTNLEAGFWHPLTWLSIMLDCQLYGRRALGHHLTSVLLHAANTTLLFVLFRRMTGATWRSFVVAALFGLHPLHVEPVAWAADRKDVLCTLFWLLTILIYVRYVEAKERRRPGSAFQLPSSACYLLSLLFFVCGLMSKTMVVTLPLILLLLDWWPLRRFQHKTQDSGNRTLGPLLLEKLPFLAVALAGGFLTILAERGIGALATTTRIPVTDRVANAVLSCVRYLLQTAWPRDLAVFYPYPATFSVWSVAGAALLLAAGSAFVWRASRTCPWFCFGWAWYLVTLLPVIGLIQVGSHAHADRYTYIPLIGIFTLLVWGACDLAARWRYRTAALSTVAVLVISLCMIFTRHQVAYWRNTETLLGHAIAVTRDNALACNNLGTALASQGRLEEAIGFLREAARLNPDDAGAHDNLGAALARQGRLDEAVHYLREAVRLNPAHAGARNDLGAALGQQGRLEEALEQLQLAVELAPGDAGAHCNLGDALASLERFDDAIRQYQTAIRIRPNYPEACCNLGIALGRTGRLDEAINRFQEALQLRPDYPAARNGLRAVLDLKAATAGPAAPVIEP